MKKIFLLMISGCISLNLFALNNLSVPIDDPVYQIIEQGQIRRLFPAVVKVKPYSCDEVRGMLEKMLDSGKLSRKESFLVKGHLERLDPYSDKPLIQSGRLSLPSKTDKTKVRIGAAISTSVNVSSDDPDNYDQRNMVDFIMDGNLTSHFSYKVDFGVRYDRLNPSVWKPYSFKSPGEGLYLRYNEGSPNDYSDGETDKHSAGFYTSPEMAASFLDDLVFLRWGMIERDWGPGDGNLLLSGTGSSFDGIETRIAPSPLLNYTFLVGTLTDWKNDKEFQNMFTIKRLEFNFPWGLEAGFSESVIWVKRNELGYMNPLMVTTIYQNTLGDFDNMYLGMDLGWTFLEGYKIYGSYAVDEIKTPNVVDWFKEVRNIMAFQGGFKAAIPGLPFTTLNLQYTRLEPFFYTHYPQNYPTYTDDEGQTEMQTHYSNKGKNLGFYLPPDSQEIRLTVNTSAIKDLFLEAQWCYFSHSAQYGESITDSIDYDKYDRGGYATKNHNANLIEMLHAISLQAQWNISHSPITLTGSYALVAGQIRKDTTLNWNNYVNNIFNLGVKLYY